MVGLQSDYKLSTWQHPIETYPLEVDIGDLGEELNDFMLDMTKFATDAPVGFCQEEIAREAPTGSCPAEYFFGEGEQEQPVAGHVVESLKASSCRPSSN
jgi:hypothetical protein